MEQLFVSNGKLNKDIWQATVVVILSTSSSNETFKETPI